jgi:hypothetical protein
MSQQPLVGHGRLYGAVLDTDHHVIDAAWQHHRESA